MARLIAQYPPVEKPMIDQLDGLVEALKLLVSARWTSVVR